MTGIPASSPFVAPLTLRPPPQKLREPTKKLLEVPAPYKGRIPEEFEHALVHLAIGSMLVWPVLATKKQIDLVRQRLQRLKKKRTNWVKKKEYFFRISRTTKQIWIGRVY